MNEWRKYGPLGVLFDFISSICTPQAKQLLQKFVQEEAKRLHQPYKELELIKPVKTRWNSYCNCLQRAVLLHAPIDDYIHYKMNEARVTASSQRRNASQREERLFIREGGLTSKDWATINEYLLLLQPFDEATHLLQGRGKSKRHGAIWEVLITFEYLLGKLEEMKERLSSINYEDPDAPEDHLFINVNAAWAKLNYYYTKLEDSPIYYAATILHPTYKRTLEALWKVPDDWDKQAKGPHPHKDWLPNAHRSFLHLYKSYKDKAAAEKAGGESSLDRRPAKRQRVGFSANRAAFIEGLAKAAHREMEETLDDEYEIWRREPPIDENSHQAINPVDYWRCLRTRFPVLARMAIDILTIPASAAECERTFSELGDLLGTRRLRIKPNLLSALQSLKSWKRIGIKRLTTTENIRELSNDELEALAEQLGDSD